MAVGFNVPFGWNVETDPANTAEYVAPTPDGPGCRLLEASFQPMTAVFVGWGKKPAPGAGRLLADSMESPELASSLAFVLQARSWEALVPLLDGVLRRFFFDKTQSHRICPWMAETL